MRSAARYIVSFLVGLIATPIVAAAVAAGIDPETASEFMLQLEDILSTAVFIALTLGSAKLLKVGTVGKMLDPGGYADHTWKKITGEKVKDMSKEQVENAVERGAL